MSGIALESFLTCDGGDQSRAPGCYTIRDALTAASKWGHRNGSLSHQAQLGARFSKRFNYRSLRTNGELISLRVSAPHANFDEVTESMLHQRFLLSQRYSLAKLVLQWRLLGGSGFALRSLIAISLASRVQNLLTTDRCVG